VCFAVGDLACTGRHLYGTASSKQLHLRRTFHSLRSHALITVRHRGYLKQCTAHMLSWSVLRAISAWIALIETCHQSRCLFSRAEESCARRGTHAALKQWKLLTLDTPDLHVRSDASWRVSALARVWRAWRVAAACGAALHCLYSRVRVSALARVWSSWTVHAACGAALRRLRLKVSVSALVRVWSTWRVGAACGAALRRTQLKAPRAWQGLGVAMRIWRVDAACGAALRRTQLRAPRTWQGLGGAMRTWKAATACTAALRCLQLKAPRALQLRRLRDAWHGWAAATLFGFVVPVEEREPMLSEHSWRLPAAGLCARQGVLRMLPAEDRNCWPRSWQRFFVRAWRSIPRRLRGLLARCSVLAGPSLTQRYDGSIVCWLARRSPRDTIIRDSPARRHGG
jgi:hypothetical protein